MSIDRKALHHTAELARLDLSLLDEAEVEALGDQLSRIVAHFDQLSAVDTEGVPVVAQPFAMPPALRDDVARETPGPEAVLENAPDRDGAYFRVPRVVGDGA